MCYIIFGHQTMSGRFLHNKARFIDLEGPWFRVKQELIEILRLQSPHCQGKKHIRAGSGLIGYAWDDQKKHWQDCKIVGDTEWVGTRDRIVLKRIPLTFFLGAITY